MSSKGLQLMHTHDFKEEQYESEENSKLSKVKASQREEPKKRIKLLEVFVERPRSMILGQRLYWHLNQVNKTLYLPHLPDAHDFYLRPLNASFFNDLKEEQEHLHQMIEGKGETQEKDHAIYTQESNTVFYYKEYKVLLLLDFSKSTSTIHAYQTKSYLEKVQESIEIIIHNLWFKLNNKYYKDDTQSTTEYDKNRKKSHNEDSGGLPHIIDQNMSSIIHEVTEEMEEGSPNFPQEKSKEEHKIPMKHFAKKSFAKEQKQNEFSPIIYLSIAASGLPPDNNIRICVHNQRLDDQNRTEVLKSLGKRLQLIIEQLVENYNTKESEVQPEYLQRHLHNANKILNLMKTSAKPLLVLMTDSTCSLMGRTFQNSQNLDTVINKLHASDTKIITIDLGDQNRLANSFGYLNHDEHLKYLAYVTCGAYFDYQTLINLAGKFSSHAPFTQLNKSYQTTLSLKPPSTFGLGLINSCFSQLTSLTGIRPCGGGTKPQLSLHHHKSLKHQHLNSKPVDLSENDQFHQHLNSLQKLMFARPCNYSGFLQHSEIQELVNFQERMIFENRVSTELVKQLRKDKNLHVNPSFNVQELLLNGRYVPIFRKEQLSEYRLYRVPLATHLCEYRSRLCFQYRKLSLDSLPTAQPTNQQLPPLNKIYYQYWWSNQVLILCTIEQLNCEQEEDGATVSVKYKLVAQEEVIEQLKRERGVILQKQAKKTTNNTGGKDYHSMFHKYFESNSEQTLLHQLTAFMSQVQACDQKMELFETVSNDIRKTYKVLRARQHATPHTGKYQQRGQHSSFTGTPREHSLHGVSGKQFSGEEEDINPSSANSQLGTRKSIKKSRKKDQKQEKGEKKKALTEERVFDYLHKHSKIWKKLCKVKVQLWNQLFTYNRLDLVTNSNLEQYNLQSSSGTLSEHIEQIHGQDFQILGKLEGLIRQYVTFQLNTSTFIQIFKEKKSPDIKTFGFCLIKLEWASLNVAVCHFGFFRVSPKNITNFIQSFKKMCLNESSGANNFGSQSLNILSEEQKKTAVFQVYDKQIVSQIIQSRDKFKLSSKAIEGSHSHHHSQSEKTKYEELQKDIEDVFCKKLHHHHNHDHLKRKVFKGAFDKQKDISYHKQWIWRNENGVTNKDFFETIVKQRFKEGFIFVNRHHTSQQHEHENQHFDSLSSYGNAHQHQDELTYVFIKIVKANKQRKGKSSGVTGKRRHSGFGKDKLLFDLDRHLDQETPDETSILIQYVIHVPCSPLHKQPTQASSESSPNSPNFEPHMTPPNSDQSLSGGDSEQKKCPKCQHNQFRTELYMEQESAYFFMEKSSIGGGSSSSFMKKEFNQGEGNVNVLSDKNFFFEIYEYINGVDQFLFNNICTYHNVVKNSVLKVTDLNQTQSDNQLIKSEVCYFNNLLVSNGQPLRSVKVRKRLRIEHAIKGKMSLLRKDWTEYLKINYPELFKNQLAPDSGLKKDSSDNLQLQQVKHDYKLKDAKLIEERAFVLQIEELLENSKLLKKENLNVPEFVFNQRPENFKEILSHFYDQILKVYEEFSDFKILKFQNELHNSNRYLYFAKLVTKQILFLIKLPTKTEFLEQILSHRGHEGSLEVEYYKLTKKMIRVSKKISKSRMLNFLNPDFGTDHQHLVHRLHEKFQHLAEKNRRISHDTSKSHEIISTTNNDPDEDDDEDRVNQIDILCDMVFIYEMSRRENVHQIQFESHIPSIIANFESYIKDNYNMIFADTVLMNIFDNEILESIKETGKLETQQDHLKNDFKQIKDTLTNCRFRMDISFLCLLVNEIVYKQGKLIDDRSESHQEFQEALDQVFHDIICRNFRQFETDQDYLVFQKNDKYDGDIIKENESLDDEPITLRKKEKHKEISEQYMLNLEGTKDSYSDSEEFSEDENHLRRKKFYPSYKDKMNKQSAYEVYQSCKKLLFKVDLQIKNANGEVIVEKRLSKFSEIFSEENREMIMKVCSELSQKAKYIVEEKHQEAKQNIDNIDQAFLEGNQKFIEEMIKQHLESRQSEHENSDAQSSVEIYFSFYTIPQYVGLIRDQDVDFLCYDQDEILVNDDDHEDLIRVTKLNNLLGMASDVSRRLEFEELSSYERDASLFKQFNKKQLVKAIPYYFKCSKKQDKDYRVYYYDEIQRKIIYGILRRTYALIAQSFLEYLSLVTNYFDPLNIIIQQKYMGALLFNQRKSLNLNIIQNMPLKTKQAEKLLNEELKQGELINLGAIEMGSEKIFFHKSSSRLKNFYLKHEYYEDDTKSSERNLVKCYNLSELEAYESARNLQKDEPYSIPFWMVFRILKNYDNSGRPSGLTLDVVFHLPMYKIHKYLSEEIIEAELLKYSKLISERIHIMLIMHKIDERREYPNNLLLDEVESHSYDQSKSLSNATSQMIQNRMLNAQNKFFNEHQSIQQPVLLPPSANTIQKQGSSISQQTVNQVQQLPSKSAVTSRFKARITQANKLSKKDTQNEQTGEHKNLTENIDTSSIATQSFLGQQNSPQFGHVNVGELFKAPKVFHHVFNLYHSVIKVEDGIQAIQDKTFFHFRVSGKDNVFVARKDDNIFLIKITGHSQHSQETKSTILKSFTQTHLQNPTQSSFNNDHSHFVNFHEDQHQQFFVQRESTKQNLTKSPIGSSFNPLQSYNKYNSQNAQQIPSQYNQIHMEIFGTQPPQKSHIEPLIQSIEMNLTRITIEKLAESLLKHPDHIYKEDQTFLEGSDNKLVLAFPIDKCQLTDKYALMMYLKQNISRFMSPVTLQQQQQLSKIRGVQGLNSILAVDEKVNQSMLSANSPGVESGKIRRFQNKMASFNESNNLNNNDIEGNLVSASMAERSMLENYGTDDEYTSIKRIDGDEKSSSISNYDLGQQQQRDFKIKFKQEDFTFLFNYSKKVGSKKNEKMGQHFTMANIFGQSLALCQLQINQDFDQQLKNLANNQEGTNFLRNLEQKVEEYFQYCEDNQFKEKFLQLGLKTTADHENCTFQWSDLKLKSYMPLVFEQKKDNQSSDFINVNKHYQVPEPSNKDPNQKWLIIKVHHIGQLQVELFIKNFILNVNQAINECLVELSLKNQITKQIEFTESQTFRITPLQTMECSQKQTDHKTISLWQNIESLENILKHGKTLQITNVIYILEKMIYGDSSDIMQTLFISMVSNLHQDLKQLQNNYVNSQQTSNHMTNISLIIELVNKTNNKTEKTLIFTLDQNLTTLAYDNLQRELKTHLNKTKTILRNLHPQFKLVLGTFKIQPPKGNNVIYKDYKTPVFEFEGLRPDGNDQHEKLVVQDSLQNDQNMKKDELENFKVYSNISKQVVLQAGNIEKQATLELPRDFFITITIQDSKLNFKSFNVDKKIRKRFKQIILSHLIWQSNRQHFFKRIVSQKLGTVYTLKDFYSSDHLIKDQTISNLYKSDRFQYEKTATIIEGKQVYNFTRALKMQQKNNQQIDSLLQNIKKSKKKMVQKVIYQKTVNKEIKEHEGKDSKNLQIEGEDFLKKIKSEEFSLKNLYKKSNQKETHQKTIGAIKEQPIARNPMKLMPKNRFAAAKAGMISTGNLMQTMNDRMFGQDQSFPLNQVETMKKLKGTKIVIKFEDFIQNKVISRPLCIREKSQELKLTHMFVISPSLQPSRANVIMEERDRLKIMQLQSQKDFKGAKNDFNQQYQCNKVLINNPLYFHGMRMIKMLKCFFDRVKYSQHLAIIYKQCEELVARKQNEEESEDIQLFKSFIHNLAGKERIKSQENIIKMLNYIIGRSRLLYSNTTQQLFDLNMLGENQKQDFFDEIHDKKHTGTVIGAENIIKVQQQNEELKVDFLNDYNLFLKQKLGVTKAILHMYSPPKEIENLKNKRVKKSAKALMSSSHVSMKRALGITNEDDLIEKPFPKGGHVNNFSRPKKFSEDFIDLDEKDQEKPKNAHGDSNSSLVISSNQQDSSYQPNFLMKKRQERVLHQINEESSDPSQQLFSYLVKTLQDDSLIIYELTYQNGLIRINVYKFDSIVKGFPRAISSTYNLYQQTHRYTQQLTIRKALVVAEEQKLSARLNTDSCNYDFHLKEISKQIVFQSKKHFNVSQQIYNLLSFYKTPPKFAKNYIDVIVLKIDLGFMNKMSGVEFLHQFLQNSNDYGFKILNQQTSSNLHIKVTEPKYSYSVIGSLPLIYSSSKQNEESKIAYAFYKEEGQKAKIQNFEQNNPNVSFLNSSRRTTSIAQQPVNIMGRQMNSPLETLDENERDYDDESQSTQRPKNEHPLRAQSTILAQNMKGQKHQLSASIIPTTPSENLGPKKLFYIELRDSKVHPDPNSENTCDVFKKVWNMQIRKQETTDSQIGADEEAQRNNTVLELVFYMIYTSDPGTQQQDKNRDIQTNVDRYPMVEVCKDMSKFMTYLSEKLSECRTNLIKDQLWLKFFDPSRKIPLTDAQIYDMLKFSFKYDLRTADDRYKEILSLDLYNLKLHGYLKYIFGTRSHSFDKIMQFSGLMPTQHDQKLISDMLIFDPEIRHFLIHVEFNYQDKKVYVYLVRKDNIDELRNGGSDTHTVNEDTTIYKNKGRVLQELMPVEENLVKQVINHITFWLWKKSV